MSKRFLSLMAILTCLGLSVSAHARNLIRLNENALIANGTEFEDVVILNGSAEIAGRVTGNVVVLRGIVRLRNTAYVGGDVVSLGGQIIADPAAIIIGSKVEIGGKIAWKALPFFSITKLLLLGFVFKVISATILMVLSIFFVLMWPAQIKFAAEEASVDLIKSILVGVLAISLLIPLAVGFAITVVGLPISLAIAVFLLITYWFGIASMSYLVGMKISGSFSPMLAVVIGLIILKFIDFVPFIGGFLYFIALLPGLGAILLTRFGTNKPWLGSNRIRLSKLKP